VTLAGKSARVAVVGGGLAGLAAAVRLVEQGASVELFEARRRLGGRARSFRHPQSGRMTDYGQHVSMGCCTALAELLRRTGLADTFQTHRRLNLVGPDGRHYSLAAGPLPAPLHLLPSLLRLNFLSLADRWHIARAIWAMKRLDQGATGVSPVPIGKGGQAAHGTPEFSRDDAQGGWAIAKRWPSDVPTDEPAEDWLRRHGQSQQAIDRFWSPVLVSALSETLDRASLHVAAKVIVDGLLASRRAYELKIPRLPLAEIFDRRLGSWLESRGVQVHRLTRVEQIEGDATRAKALLLSKSGATAGLPSSASAKGDSPIHASPSGYAESGQSPPGATGVPPVPAQSHGRDARGTPPVEFDAVIVAVPWDRVGQLLSPELRRAVPELDRVEQIGPAAITTVHLGYDRPITELPHAMLVGRLAQWVFQKPGNQYQVVISASHRLVKVSREELAGRIERELAEVFPAAASARVLHRRVIVQPRAVFSACPGIDQLRPTQETPIANLALAGDWTATGWPATMEGAVRSGNEAAEVILCRL